MPNKTSECVDRASVNVDSIPTNKTNLSSTPDINLLLEEALRKIQYLDIDYQKMTQDIEALQLAVAQYEQEKVAYYRTISKLVVQDVIVAAKTEAGIQEVQDTQSRHDVALQQHQSKLTAHNKKMNNLEADMKHKVNNERLISIEESLEALKETQAQQSERIDSVDEKFEDLISKMQMDERNARRRSRISLEESIEVYREPSREELKKSLKEARQNISLTRSHEQQAVDRPRLDSGVSISTMKSSKSMELLSDAGPISSLPITSPVKLEDS